MHSYFNHVISTSPKSQLTKKEKIHSAMFWLWGVELSWHFTDRTKVILTIYLNKIQISVYTVHEESILVKEKSNREVCACV